MDRAPVEPTPPDRLQRVAEAMLRAGQIESAASCYAEMRQQGNELEAGPGLLRCLCRLGRWPEALQAADELERAHPHSEALLKVIYQTWYDGRFWRLDPECPLERLKTCADTLFGTGLYVREAPYIVLGLARSAAHFEQWDRALDWTGRIRPLMLKPKRRGDWYDCRAQAMLAGGRAAETLGLVHDLPARYPALRHRFLIHMLRAYLLLDSPLDAAAIYDELTREEPPPVWVHVEYARLARSLGLVGDAVVLFSRAALLTRPLVAATQLTEDLAELMLVRGWYVAAREHLLLNVWLRQVRGAHVPERLRDLLAKATAGCYNPDAPAPDRMALLVRCRAIWRHQAVRALTLHRDFSDARRVMWERRGTLLCENGEWLVRTTSGIDFPCPAELVPAEVPAGTQVRFGAVPAFDRDRRIETWKMIRLTPKSEAPPAQSG